MGWPRKNECVRLYRLPGNDYRLYFAHEGIDPDTGEHSPELEGKFRGELLFVRWSKKHKKQVLEVEEVPKTYGGNAKRVSWNDLPASWQQYLKESFEKSPAEYRGLFRIGETYTEQKELPLD